MTFDFIFPYDAMAPDLKNFSTENFSTKKNFFSKFRNGSIRKVIRSKSKFESIFRFQPIMRASLLDTLNMSSKMNDLNKWDNLDKSRSQS